MRNSYGIISIFFISAICFGCINTHKQNNIENSDELRESENITEMHETQSSIQTEIIEDTTEPQTESQETESSTAIHSNQYRDLNSYIINKNFVNLISENNPIDATYNATEIPYDTEGMGERVR